ncbi:multi-sensor hybrid histidine kinase [Roseivivax lentus]|uniref:histidine kinase n=1 Tax=Roseivivax lentus TaxID=633194 RepID=A0A1N7LW67_9RHOB|nr:ATP-binding protein [Roseivivax lentus]SIS78057.1 multi-sensor hybrid histidine kinase [Roseivivax lentus]
MASDIAQGAARHGVAKGALMGAIAILGVAVAVFAFDLPINLPVAMGACAAVVSAAWVIRHLPPRRGSRQVADSGALDFAALVEGDPVAGCVCDASGRVLALNAAAEARFALYRDGLLSEVFAGDVADPAALVTSLTNRAIAAIWTRETLLYGSDRIDVTVRAVGDVFHWRLDAVEGTQAVLRDTPLVSVGRQGVVLSMNKAARDLVGQRARTVSQLVADPPIDTSRVYEVLTPGGPRPFHISVIGDGPGRSELAMFPVARAANGAGAGLDTLPIALLKVTPEGKIVFATRQARRLFSADRVEGEPVARFMEGLGRSIADWLQDAAAGKGLTKSEFLRLSREDREVFVQVTLARVQEEGRTLLVAVLNDATELKTLEAQFVQSQKMQAIGQLAGGVAHDFNNLLTAISGHCDLMLLRHDPGDPDYGDLIQINQNANRAAGLVGQLLAFSRKQTLRPEILDLRETLADLTHLLNRLVGEKTTLTLRHDPLLPPIRGDRRQLEQVMMNLVVNARDAMPEGGRIEVETDCVTLAAPLERDRVKVPPGRYVVVRVKDAGMGIPNDKLQKVFEPFYTTKRLGEGTGLGLSTVYGIIKQTGAYIFVDSEVGQGTTFSLYFRAHERQADQPVAIAPPPPRVSTRGRDGVILLVEDEAPVRAFASRALRLRGYTVIEADSAEAALDILSDSAVEVDLFVSDVIMPGLDGPSWVKKARQDRPDVGVIFVSGYAEDALERTGSDMNNMAFLPKPFSLDALSEMVQRQLG